MKQSQTERLSRVLVQNKSASPQRILPALKSDLRDLIRHYGELHSDITVDIQESEGIFQIILVARVSRFKNCGNVV